MSKPKTVSAHMREVERLAKLANLTVEADLSNPAAVGNWAGRVARIEKPTAERVALNTALDRLRKALETEIATRNRKRANLALEALNTIPRKTGSAEDEGERITDLLSNLMHLCDYVGRDFDARLTQARKHYEAEVAK